MTRRIEFYYAIGSRYSYLAAARLESLAQRAQLEIDWLPLNSVRLLEERGYSPFDHVEIVGGQYSPEYRERDAQRWAELYGIPFVEPRGRLQLHPELLALAATAGKRLGAAAAVSHALFAAVFHGEVARLDAEECVRAATEGGVARGPFQRALTSAQVRRELDETMLRAHLRGVFGVPTFIVDGEQFWGNDRLPLLERYLERASP